MKYLMEREVIGDKYSETIYEEIEVEKDLSANPRMKINYNLEDYYLVLKEHNHKYYKKK